MAKLEKLHLFLRFYFSPWGAAKGERWEAFSRDRPFSPYYAERICAAILSGADETSQPMVDWSALEGF